jgi:hypothetical protein
LEVLVIFVSIIYPYAVLAEYSFQEYSASDTNNKTIRDSKCGEPQPSLLTVAINSI